MTLTARPDAGALVTQENTGVSAPGGKVPVKRLVPHAELLQPRSARSVVDPLLFSAARYQVIDAPGSTGFGDP
ncbi:hypothetical protein WDJ51_06505 [Rathayibacter sp. YIM 133350]|uniref:hypothetical protein n=1 Tax=Rathayibacter sp. YIM 133350 TaxID=3131992 RepID=UPI00307F9873